MSKSKNNSAATPEVDPQRMGLIHDAAGQILERPDSFAAAFVKDNGPQIAAWSDDELRNRVEYAATVKMNSQYPGNGRERKVNFFQK